MDSKCIICIRFSKIFSGRPDPPPPPYCESIKNSPLLAVYDPLQLSWKFSRNTYFEDRSFEGKNYIQFCGKKSTRTRQKMGSECTICIHFSKIFSGRPRPPLLQEHKKLPSLVVYDPLQLSWKFSRNTYFEDRSFEGKNYTQFLGKKSTRTRQKLAQNAPFASIFQKFSRWDPDPPPYCKSIKTPLFCCIWSSTAKLEIFPQHVCRRSELWGQKLHTIFGEVINTNSAKNGLRMHHLHPFFKNFPGGGPPDPHLQEGVSPSRTLPLRRFAPIPLRPPGSGPSGSATGHVGWYTAFKWPVKP